MAGYCFKKFDLFFISVYFFFYMCLYVYNEYITLQTQRWQWPMFVLATSIFVKKRFWSDLKVDGNEKLGGWGLGKDTVVQVLSAIVAFGGYFNFERVLSL
jgi:hypothetical protein